MKTTKKIIAMLIAAVMCIGMICIPAFADTDTKTVTPADPAGGSIWYVNGTTVKTGVTMRVKNPQKGFVILDASSLEVSEGSVEEYIQNAPSITLSMKQSNFADAFASRVYGIEENKDDYTATADYSAVNANAGTLIGDITGTGKIEVSIDVTDYVKSQADKKYVFKIAGYTPEGGTAGDVRFNTFSLTFDYSDSAKAKAAINSIEGVNTTASEDFTLPATGKFDTEITWSSSDTAIAIDGANATVTRPSEAEGDKKVTLTASVTIGENTETREFIVTVPAIITSDVVRAMPNADSYAQKSNPDTNFNDTKNLYINGSGRQNFIRFNVMDINADEVGEAVLNLYLREIKNPAADKDSFGITLYGLSGQDKTSWEESTLTYNVGAELGLLDSSLESYGSGTLAANKIIGYNETESWISIDITDYIKSQSDGVYALRICGDNVQAYFNSREYENEELRPYLEISRGDAGAVIKDTKALTIADNVSENFVLPTEGENGSQITWTSDNSSVVIDGANADVSAIEEETTVTLTATITKGEYERTKEFKVTITPINAEADVEADTNALFVPSAVQESFELAAEGTHGSSIAWESSNTDVIAIENNTAVVSEVTEETTVTLTATVSKKNKSATKSFEVKVLPIGGDTSEADAAADNAAISLPETVNEDFTLPVKGEKGSDISWQSDSSLITIDGETAHVTVTSEEKTVTLTATVKNGEYTKTRNFTIKIVTDGKEGAITDFTALTIPAYVYEGLILPIAGANGSKIAWTTDSSLITIDGANLTAQKVTEKTDAVLTATVTNGNFKDSKEFTVTILTNMITVTADGSEITSFKEGQSIRVGIADGVQFNDGEQMHIATYGMSGELLHIWWGLNNYAKIDITADGNIESIGVFVWKNDMQPVVCEHMQKVSE